MYHSPTTKMTLYQTKDGECFVVKTKDFIKELKGYIKETNAQLKTLRDEKYEIEKFINNKDLSYSEKETERHYVIKLSIGFMEKILGDKLEMLEKTLKEAELATKEMKNSGKLDLEEAKKVPISNFVDFNRSGFARCLWHNERSGSMKYYPKQNKVHCFGACGKSRDVVDVIQKLRNCSVSEAIKILTS